MYQVATEKSLVRETFESSRLLEYFSEKELNHQIGHGKQLWPIVLVKELVDNALDACESAGVAPEIEIEIGDDFFRVRDNGPGIPERTLERSLDYLVRVSDKHHYIAPTRGQLGNALKCLYAAGFVAHGEGRVDIRTRGRLFTVTVDLDRIRQEPKLELDKEASDIEEGAEITVRWPDLACSTEFSKTVVFYKPITFPSLAAGFASFNPHATITLNGIRFEATEKDWKKWTPSMPTSCHWYSADDFRDLIAANVSTGNEKTVRAFVSEFDGLSGTAKQKKILAATGLKAQSLAELVVADDLDVEQVKALLSEMKDQARAVAPKRLGIIGKDHLRRCLKEMRCHEDSIEYKCIAAEDEDLPFVLETAFGLLESGQGARQVLTGVNWSPTLQTPFEELNVILSDCAVDPFDPAVLVVHLATPKPKFTDRGKGRLDL